MEKAHTAEPGMLCREKRIHVKSMLDLWSLLCLSRTRPDVKRDSSRASPVHLCGEHSHHRGNPVDVDDVSDGPKHIEVEERLSWH